MTRPSLAGKLATVAVSVAFQDVRFCSTRHVRFDVIGLAGLEAVDAPAGLALEIVAGTVAVEARRSPLAPNTSTRPRNEDAVPLPRPVHRAGRVVHGDDQIELRLSRNRIPSVNQTTGVCHASVLERLSQTGTGLLPD
jgi:hypothetical protein